MHTIYIRTLKKAEHTVFCVANGQKTYFDPQFNRLVPYSSGQQIKRSIIDRLSTELNEIPAPVTFLFDVTKKKEITEGEVFGTCDPSNFDQLLGGWMKAIKGGKEKTIKRRSPFSISAMRALHPLLAGINKEDITFDRSGRSNNKVIVRDPEGNYLSEDDIRSLLEDKDRSLVRKWIPDHRTVTGLFVQDIAIDLRRLFCISLNIYEPEINQPTEKKLRENGWIEAKNIFGDCLVAPPKTREKLIPAISKAIINWQITSNQSRTFSLMETLAVAVSDNANKIASSIRGKLSEENENRAVPVIEENFDGVDIFITLTAGGYVLTKSEKADALELAEQNIINKINAFDYENQLNG
ncbi:MAG: CRISPR-associated protein Cas7 [Desulfobacteraceae bacterium]|nr:CRISPR-associated protein Cas7 [Desulfobacteraceae bacterium]MBC2720120.1 CRISPR-associated protein Cas7 [Desulfobacteraceae bacterium]